MRLNKFLLKGTIIFYFVLISKSLNGWFFFDQSMFNQEVFVLTYKDSFGYELDEKMTWKVFTKGGKLYQRGKGSIAGFVFSIEGEYIIDLRQPVKFGQRKSSEAVAFDHSQCNHSPFPDEINLKVLPNYLLYDFENIEFSRPIAAGNWNGEVISLFADFESLSGNRLLLQNLEIIYSGVGATLRGKIIPSKNPVLQGELVKGTYILLNFVDVNVDDKWVDTTFITFKDNFEYYLDSGMVWKIRNQNDSLIYAGVSSINSIVFPLPGVYVLDLNQPVRFGMGRFADSVLPLNHDLCNHSPFPDELVILVSDTHLKFDFSTIRFNKELSGGSNNDVILTVDGHYEQFSESELNREDIVVIASGVGANLKSKALNVDAKLINGNNSFSFQLSGSLKSDTYIQLDFNVPKQIIQSYSHLTKIK